MSAKYVRARGPGGATVCSHGCNPWSAVSKSQEEIVKNYIVGQAGHHKKEDFNSELVRMLRAHGVEFDEKYVCD